MKKSLLLLFVILSISLISLSQAKNSKIFYAYKTELSFNCDSLEKELKKPMSPDDRKVLLQELFDCQHKMYDVPKESKEGITEYLVDDYSTENNNQKEFFGIITKNEADKIEDVAKTFVTLFSGSVGDPEYAFIVDYTGKRTVKNYFEALKANDRTIILGPEFITNKYEFKHLQQHLSSQKNIKEWVTSMINIDNIKDYLKNPSSYVPGICKNSVEYTIKFVGNNLVRHTLQLGKESTEILVENVTKVPEDLLDFFKSPEKYIEKPTEKIIIIIRDIPKKTIKSGMKIIHKITSVRLN